MTKVYCKNCKHYFSFWNTYNDVCGYESEFYFNAIGDECCSPRYCEPVNKDNNCKHYERKWYKFWIRQPKLSGKIERPKPWPKPFRDGDIKSPPMPTVKKAKQ